MDNTSDVVERLRDAFERNRYGGEGEYDPDADLFDVAADTIERLRAELEQIKGHNKLLQDNNEVKAHILGTLTAMLSVALEEHDTSDGRSNEPAHWTNEARAMIEGESRDGRD